MSLRTDELDYDLPPELIATKPAEPRDSARMMVLSRSRPDIEHRSVRDLPSYLRRGDALILNDTAVMPARLVGRHAETGGRAEGLFLAERGTGVWEVMLRSGRPLRAGQHIQLLDHDRLPSGIELTLQEPSEQAWLASVGGSQAVSDAPSILAVVGRTPLPPYILKARGSMLIEDDDDRAWYQTVFADMQRRQSVAAPTAGLHFTPELLSRIELQGIRVARITLHVGPGTFKPVTAETLSSHVMGREQFEISPTTMRLISSIAHDRRASPRDDRPRLIAVGTTVVRALESLPDDVQSVDAGVRGETDLLIAPPYRFRFVDGMLTNFHLPRSTLLALVAAMVGPQPQPQPQDAASMPLRRIKAVYREAISRRYRFYSYGDAMLILP